jgi:hypothetical protein
VALPFCSASERQASRGRAQARDVAPPLQLTEGAPLARLLVVLADLHQRAILSSTLLGGTRRRALLLLRRRLLAGRRLPGNPPISQNKAKQLPLGRQGRTEIPQPPASTHEDGVAVRGFGY